MRAAVVAFIAAMAVACGVPAVLKPSLQDAPTHERYAAALKETGLDQVALGRDWLQAAARALEQPQVATLPFSQTGYLPPERPAAVGFRLELRRGRRLAIDVAFQSSEPARFFVDLFELREDEAPRRVAGLEPGAGSFEYDVRRDGVYVLRLQPELARGGRYTVTQRSLASLQMPIKGFRVEHVRSGFGAPRDGGVRDHHGIDIFAPRGTPVLASTDGMVQRDESERGGRVIWLRDSRTGRNVYYAHLNDWAVESGASVRAGDVIGYVGNTGNARTTPPHLHFGVYERGPADPVPFVLRNDPAPRGISAPTEALGRWMRVARVSTPLRSSVESRPPEAAGPLLVRDTVLRVIAATGPSFRVDLPDGRSGLVRAADLAPTDVPIRTVAVSGSILAVPDLGAPAVEILNEPRQLPVLGRFGDFSLVRLRGDRLGWAPIRR